MRSGVPSRTARWAALNLWGVLREYIKPVGRAFNSQMKTYKQLVAGILTQVLDDIEDERVRQGKKRIVLNSTLPYAKIVEDINKTWENEFLEGKKPDEGVEILG